MKDSLIEVILHEETTTTKLHNYKPIKTETGVIKKKDLLNICKLGCIALPFFVATPV